MIHIAVLTKNLDLFNEIFYYPNSGRKDIKYYKVSKIEDVEGIYFDFYTLLHDSNDIEEVSKIKEYILRYKKTVRGEDKIEIKTFVKFDFIDCLKLLFGRALQVKVFGDVLIKDNKISGFDLGEEIIFISTTSYFIKANKPKFGWIPKQDNYDR